MQYVKLGPVRIPYEVKTENGVKTCRICGMKLPFSSHTKGGKKYYTFCGVTFHIPGREKIIITQGRENYLRRDTMTDAEIQETAASIFEEKLGYAPDLKDPKTFNEKIFWLKLHYHNPLVTTCCDKFAVKDYVNQVLGPGYVIPTLKSWEKAEDLDLTGLPEKYVLKVNWSSGYNVIVRDASQVDPAEVKAQVAHWMEPAQNSYFQTFNWGYKNMKPVVYAEEYMEQIAGQLYDYKFYCCGGKAKFLFIATNRASKSTLTYDFFDMDFNKLPFFYGGRQHSQVPLEKPRFFHEMVACAEKLAKPFPFVRVDFYETADHYYVGEMTFYSGGGILGFDPPDWDRKLGDMIDLSEIMK